MDEHHPFCGGVLIKLYFTLRGAVFKHVSKDKENGALNGCRNISCNFPCWFIAPAYAVIKSGLGVQRDQLVPVVFLKLNLLLKQTEIYYIENIYRLTLKGGSPRPLHHEPEEKLPLMIAVGR